MTDELKRALETTLSTGKERHMIPVGKLRLGAKMINPPKPDGFDVVVDGKSIAVIGVAEFKRAAARLLEMEAAREGEQSGES